MDFSFSEADLEFQREVRTWLEDAWPEETRERRARSALGRTSRQEQVEWQQRLAERGWAAPNWPVEHGGAGFTPTQNYLFDLEMARAGAPRVLPFGITHGGAGHHEIRHGGAEAAFSAGHPEFPSLVVPRLLRTRRRFGFGVPKAQGGGPGRPLPGQRRQDLDHAGAACRLDFLPSAHQLGGETATRHQFPVDRHAVPGSERQAHRHPDQPPPGLQEINTVYFEDVEVPKANLIGEEGRGWTCAKYLLEFERGNAYPRH